MTKREEDKSPKVWRDNPGTHFNAYWSEIYSDKRLHERGLETKIRVGMGERIKDASKKRRHMRQAITAHANHAPITLPTLKWGKD